ncbi:MAG: DUF5719 family protein, partial [Acidimicrobiales bacterium]
MRSRALAALLVAGLVVVAVTSSLSSPVNPTGLPGALANPAGVESSALYCTGLSDATGATQGAVVLLNTTDSTRDAHVTVVSDTGRLAEEPLTLAAHDSVSVEPDRLAAGHLFGVSVVVAGGGVVADEVAGSMSSAVPCASDAVTSWYGSGFDTTVGSTATLSFYNPTATPAVVNVTAYTAHGFVAPAPYQGLPVGAHAEVAVNIGSAIVNSANVGVRVNVVRGALVVTGVEDSLSVGSLDGGAAAATAQSWFPRVTTVS